MSLYLSLLSQFPREASEKGEQAHTRNYYFNHARWISRRVAYKHSIFIESYVLYGCVPRREDITSN
jgi:hypothetical protein